MSDLAVHPVADLFPMLADDELAELAADIKQRGLLQPIVLDAEGRVLDGRNRLAACELAGIEPTFVTYEGDDADGEAWAYNMRRRDLTKAKRAIAAADRFVDKSLSQREIAKAAGTSQTMIGWAIAVRRYIDLHDAVLAGGSLKDAYDEAQQRDAAEADRQARIGRLRESAPDLISLVDDERMSLDDATAALDARVEKARIEAETLRREAEERASEAERQVQLREQERQESLERDRNRLRSVITGWPTMRNTILPDPDGELAAEITAGLGESDQEALAKILAELKG